MTYLAKEIRRALEEGTDNRQANGNEILGEGHHICRKNFTVLKEVKSYETLGI